MTLYLLKVHPQTFLCIPITQKCQILSCDTLVANERNAVHRSVYLYVIFTVLICPYTTVYVYLGSGSELFLHLNNTLSV